MVWYGMWVLPLSVELRFYPQKTRTKSRIGFTVSDSCLKSLSYCGRSSICLDGVLMALECGLGRLKLNSLGQLELGLVNNYMKVRKSQGLQIRMLTIETLYVKRSEV